MKIVCAPKEPTIALPSEGDLRVVLYAGLWPFVSDTG